MQKIGNITSTADANGEWTNGNVAAGTAPTILDAAWLNTIQREIANVVTGAGLTLNPSNDAQLLASLLSLTGPGRLLAVKYIASSSTYTPTAGTKKIFVQGIGTGGNGAGSTATAATGCTACAGGGSGSHAEAWYTSGFSSVVVTIGSLGPANYGNGANGATSSFGALMVLPGGSGGGSSAQASSVVYFENGGGLAGGVPTLTGAISGIVTSGNFGMGGKVFAGQAVSGQGGGSPFGQPGGNVAIASGSSAGGSALGYGSGGGGAGVAVSSTQQYGGNGALGLFIVWEYT